MSGHVRRLMVLFLCAVLPGCYALRGSSGGGETSFTPPRQVDAADVVLPDGYVIEAVATGLTFPTGVAFDDVGGVYVVEAGYSYGEVFTTPRLFKVEPGGTLVRIAEGGRRGPWTGVTWYRGNFYVAEGSQLEGGRILRIAPGGTATPLVEGLPSRGDHHTDGPAVGPDGWIYFGQGTATNSGVVGEDNAEFGWLKRFPDFHDVPCRDVTLTGENFTTPNPLRPGEEATTGAFVPFGARTEKGQVVRGEVPCSGAVMRVRPEGGDVELVAWGFRNPFGLAFSPDGTLFVTDNSYDDRGSRPVWGTGDLLWEVQPGAWYGWPDFHGDHSLADKRFESPAFGKTPEPLLAGHPNTPPKPAAVLPVHSSSNGFDFSRSDAFGHVGEAFIAQFGDEATATGKILAPVGYKVVRVDVKRGVSRDFAVNRGKGNGPASLLRGGGLERPVAARFDPSGEFLYVVDFGVMLHRGKGAVPMEKTGVLWRISRKSAPGEKP